MTAFAMAGNEHASFFMQANLWYKTNIGIIYLQDASSPGTNN